MPGQNNGGRHRLITGTFSSLTLSDPKPPQGVARDLPLLNGELVVIGRFRF